MRNFANKQDRRYSDPKARNGYKILGHKSLPKNQNSSTKNSSKILVKKFVKTFVKKIRQKYSLKKIRQTIHQKI